jgi:hypothetical protein
MFSYSDIYMLYALVEDRASYEVNEDTELGFFGPVGGWRTVSSKDLEQLLWQLYLIKSEIETIIEEEDDRSSAVSHKTGKKKA